MKPFRWLVAAALICTVLPRAARSQALPALATLRVGYNTQKNTIKPTGEMKARIDEIDRQIADASRLGRNGELRRLFAMGRTLLAGGVWTDTLDYANSMVVRSERVVVDSAKPYTVRLEQIYSPSIALSAALQAHATLRKRPAAVGAGGAPPQPGELVKDLGTFEGVSRDLRESPFPIDIDLHDVADGTYQIGVEVLEPGRLLGAGTLVVAVRKGLDDLVQQLENDARRAPDALRADILFPVERMRAVNRGLLELARTFDPDREFADALAVAAAAKAGKNPFAGRTGDFKRHYLLASANEIMPYRVHVPKTYTDAKPFPLVVALHGVGGTEDYFFGVYDDKLPSVAEQHGYIVVAPMGYRIDGGYGWGVANPPDDPATRRLQERSEQDVMQVLQLVKQQYRIDENRMYLLGHSMGGIGTWKVAAKYPDIWAAIAPISGNGQPATLERMKQIPEIVVHGDADATVNVQGSRTMVAKMKELGIEHVYIEVPGGSHRSVIGPSLDQIFTFFDAHSKSRRSSQ
jgi:poly(3-hydroxybutyrate) depolymerase